MSVGLPRAVVVALARYRQRWGLTLDQLAERTGTTTAALTRYEEGTAVPDPAEAEALITVLQLDDVAATALRAAAEGKSAEARSEPASPGGRFDGWDDKPSCFVTTIGRRTGRPHEHQCDAFVVDGERLYLLDVEGAADKWFRDIQANPGVSLRVAPGRVQTGRATELGVGHPDAERARLLAARKYPAQRSEVAAAAVVVVEAFEVG